MAGNSKDRQPDSKPSSRRLSADRAQSETVGVLLITAVVIILVASVGFVLTSNAMSQMETGPQITISGEASQDDLTVYHLGGARLEVSELDVVLRGDSTERYPLSSFTQRRGSNETWFERGDRWQREHGLSGDSVEVLVVHTPSETVVGRTTLELRPTGPFFEVDITGTNSPVEQGETLEVDAAVENTGIDTGTQDLEFSFDGTVQETESITLSPDQRTSRTFNFDTSSVDPGTYTVTASTDNRTDERTVTVEEPRANITITDVEGMPDETTNHSYQPAVTIEESAGIETDGLQVEFIIDERDTNVTAFEELRELNEISSSSVTADFDVGELDVNNYNYFATASADNAITDSRSGEFVVGEPPFFNVSIEGTNSPVTSGNTLRVDAKIENTGGFEGTQTITLDVSGQRDSRELTLDSGENRTITLEWDTPNSAHNDSPYDATVRSDDDSDTVEVVVDNQATLSVETGSATSIDTSSATLNGELTDLGSANEADVYFQYRKNGTSTWTETTRQTLDSTVEFDETILDLESDTDYEFRAVAESEDGSDLGDTLTFTTTSTDPTVLVRVDDLSDRQPNDPEFYVSYDFGGSFDEVEITAESTESTASATAISTDSRGGVSLTPGAGDGEEFEVTVTVIEDGQTVSERTLVTNADTQNPVVQNDDLSRGDSATLESSAITDRTQTGQQDNVRYRFSYDVSPTGSFSEIRMYVLNENGNGASGSTTETRRDRNNVDINPGTGANTSYKLAMLVLDNDGAVVDDRIENDIANGEGID